MMLMGLLRNTDFQTIFLDCAEFPPLLKPRPGVPHQETLVLDEASISFFTESL